MIFTHIFRYLDDKDAEELRRLSTDNSSSPGINSRFQDSVPSWEHRDVRFKQISVKAPSVNGTVGRVFQTVQRKDALATGYTSLRAASARTCSRPRVLPPIRGSQATGGGKQSTLNDINSAKLPAIEPFASPAQPRAKEKRSWSRRNKEAVFKSDACVQNLRQDHGELKNSHKKVMAEENNAEDILKGHLQIEEKGTGQKTASFYDMSVARAGVKKDYHKSFPQTVKQHEFETRTELGSDINNAITADENCTLKCCSVSEQCSGKTEWKRTQEHTKTKIEYDDFYKCVGLSQLNKTEHSSFSAKLNQELGKLNDTIGNTQNTENLHIKSKQTVLEGDGFVATANVRKDICHFELVACERGRRNAICEVLEKSTEPQFGSSLYEMRQNLIQLS